MRTVFLTGLVIFLLILPKHTLAGAYSTTVTIQNFQFLPREIQVTPGTVVIWQNNDSSPHTSTADDINSGEGWSSGTLATGQTFSKTFSKPGIYTYYCNIHPSMRGTVQVVTEGQQVVTTTPIAITQPTYLSTPAPIPLVTPAPVTQLPSTGIPLVAYLVMGFIPLGLGFMLFGKGKNFKETAKILWERRQFKSR